MELRPATVEDRDPVCALGVVEEDAWFGSAEHTAGEVGEWIDEEGGFDGGVVAVDAEQGVRGFASPGRHGMVYLADPAEPDALADLLLPWLQEQRDAVQLLTFGADLARIGAFERHGLRHVRSSFTLARPAAAGPLPDAAFPAGVGSAGYRLGEDDEAVHRLVYVDAAFGAVEGHTERDLGEWREKERRSSMFLARRDSRPVGFVSGHIGGGGRGEVGQLAVAAGERGRGIGRALLLQAFGDLQTAGAHDLSLDVEADNEAALGLYRSVGLGIEREWRTYSTAAR